MSNAAGFKEAYSKSTTMIFIAFSEYGDIEQRMTDLTMFQISFFQFRKSHKLPHCASLWEKTRLLGRSVVSNSDSQCMYFCHSRSNAFRSSSLLAVSGKSGIARTSRAG